MTDIISPDDTTRGPDFSLPPGNGSGIAFDVDRPIVPQLVDIAHRFARIFAYAFIPLFSLTIQQGGMWDDALISAAIAALGTAWREITTRTTVADQVRGIAAKVVRRPYTTAGSRGFGTIGAPGSKVGRAWATKNITRFTLSNGVKINAHRQVGPILVAFMNECIAKGYPIRQRDTGSWNHRWINRLGRPLVGRLSNHSWGTAVDINWQANPQAKRLITNMPDWMIKLGESKYRLAWGGRFRTPDAMHWEWGGTLEGCEVFRKTLGV